jgi:hypothetical protein
MMRKVQRPGVYYKNPFISKYILAEVIACLFFGTYSVCNTTRTAYKTLRPAFIILLHVNSLQRERV